MVQVSSTLTPKKGPEKPKILVKNCCFLPFLAKIHWGNKSGNKPGKIGDVVHNKRVHKGMEI